MKIFYQTTLTAICGVGLFCLTACNGTETVNEPKPSQPSVEKTAEAGSEPMKLAEPLVSKLPEHSPTYKVITTGSMPPFSFYNEKGELMGLDIDAVQAIAEAGGFKVQFYTHPWQGIFDTVESGKYDLSASGISYTDERAKTYGLSKRYFFNPSAIMVKASLPNVKKFLDIKNLRIAGMKESKQLAQANTIGATSMTGYDTTFLAFKALVQDKEDVVLQDEPFLRYTAKQYPEQKINIIPYEDAKEPSAQQIILMKKDNKNLINQVNKGIDTVLNNGEMKKIEEKWLGAKS